VSASRRFPFSIPSKHLGVLDGMENPRVTPGCGIRGSSAPKVRPIPAWAARPRDGAGGRIEDQRSVPSAAVPKGRTTRGSGPMDRAFSPPDFALPLIWAWRPRLVWNAPLALKRSRRMPPGTPLRIFHSIQTPRGSGWNGKSKTGSATSIQACGNEGRFWSPQGPKARPIPAWAARLGIVREENGGPKVRPIRSGSQGADHQEIQPDRSGLQPS